MSTTPLVHPGRSVRVIETSGDEQAFSSLVEDVQDGLVVIQTPTVHYRLVPLVVGSRVSVVLRDGQKAFAFDADVLDNVKGPPPLTVLRPASEPRLTEQRRYYRLPITLAPTAAEALDRDGGMKPIRALVNDISGGGLAFISPRRLNVGEHVRFLLPVVPGKDEFDLEVTVLAVEEPDENRFNYRYHSEFVGMKKWIRERIIRFIFREQLKRLQKGVA